MQVDTDAYGGRVEGGDGGSRQGAAAQESMKMESEDLERGLKELIPSLCAYLRGHTEVRLEGTRELERDLRGAGACYGDSRVYR